MRGTSKNARKALAEQMGVFLRQYKRKAQKGCEPNDRGYDRSVEQYLRRLRAEDLDLLLNGEQEERLNFGN